jgi:hypothetical protein
LRNLYAATPNKRASIRVQRAMAWILSAPIVLMLVMMATPANACLGPPLEQYVFFTTVPDEARLAARVTVTEVDQASLTATARVEEVLVGHLPSRTIKLVFPAPSSCGPHVRTGASGIVFGKLRDVEHLVIESRSGTD